MSRKRSTKPTDGPVAGPREQYESVSVRRISNGHIVSHSKSNGDKYTSTEVYHKQAPKLAPLVKGAGKDRANRLLEATSKPSGKTKG